MYAIVIFMAFALIVYVRLIWNKNYWKNRKVPHEKPSFLLGSLSEVVRGTQHIHLKYTDLYRKFRNYPYAGYFKLISPAVVIIDPDIIRNILIKDFDNFADNDFRVNEKLDHIWAGNPFIQHGKEWSDNRKRWTYAMTTNKLKATFDSSFEKTEVMINFIKKHFKDDPNQSLEPRQLASKFLTDIVVNTVFGLELNSFDNPNNKYKKISESIFLSDNLACFATLCFLVVPWLGRFLKFRFVNQEMEKNLMSCARDVLKNREKNGFQKNNSLDALLITKDRKENDAITEREMAIALFGFLIDAIETSSGIGGITIYTLAQYPEVQQKLYEEIEKAISANDGKVTYDTIHQLQYLDMVLSETLRIHTPLLAFQRCCTKPYKLPPPCPGADPVIIPKGMTVIIPTYALHMDPEYFPDPEKFNPERFSEENKGKLKKYTYMPFGEGPRICLGMRMGVKNVKILLVALVKHFEIKLHPKMEGKSLVINPQCVLINRNIGDLWVTFHERNLV